MQFSVHVSKQCATAHVRCMITNQHTISHRPRELLRIALMGFSMHVSEQCAIAHIKDDSLLVS